MTQLKLSDETARKLFPEAGPVLKEVLIESFGKTFFEHQIKSYKDIVTFEICCKVTKEDPADKKFNEGAPDDIAYQQLKVMCRALNMDFETGVEWVPDYENQNQRKWWGWFYLNKPAFRLHAAGYGHSSTSTSGGVRLCLKEQEIFMHAVEYFLPIFKNFYS